MSSSSSSSVAKRPLRTSRVKHPLCAFYSTGQAVFHRVPRPMMGDAMTKHLLAAMLVSGCLWNRYHNTLYRMCVFQCVFLLESQRPKLQQTTRFMADCLEAAFGCSCTRQNNQVLVLAGSPGHEQNNQQDVRFKPSSEMIFSDKFPVPANSSRPRTIPPVSPRIVRKRGGF